MTKSQPAHRSTHSASSEPRIQSASFRRQRTLWLAAALGVGCLATTADAQLTLNGTSYTQDFDSIGGGLPAGWTGRTGASATSLGTAVGFTTTATLWNSSTGAFANYAAADNNGTAFTGTESTAVQNAATDRAFAMRQTAAVGEPGAAFTLQILNTVDLSNFSLSFSEQMLSVQARSTTWTVQYGLGSAPSTFTNLGTAYTDPGTFGSTAFTISGSALDAIANQSQNVWIRIVALAASTGSGSRDTFGIDDFNLTWTAAPVVSDYWDPNGNAVGIGGDGTWDTNTANWGPSSAGTSTTTVFDSTHIAIFGNTTANPSLVTVANGVVANKGIQFDANGYTLTRGGTAKITVTNAADTASIATQLLGSLGLTKAGLGKLVLKNATNTYSGGTTISAGTLVIDADGELGAASGGITMAGGTLQSTADVELLGGRTVTGTGSFDVAPATTLKVDGAVTDLNLTLTNTGTVNFAGAAAPALTGLTLAKFASVSSTLGTIGIVGNLTTQNTTGTVTFANTLDFGSVASAVRVINVTDGDQAVDLLISGPLKIAGTSARIEKLGAGTLELSSTANSLTGGIRLGEGGLPSVDGGTLRIQSKTALGAGIFQANAGTLVVLSDMTGANAPASAVGLSIGANDTAPVTITGSDIEFPGASSLFVNGSTGYQNKIVVNSNVLISGSLTGTALSTGLTITGTGSVTMSAATNAVTSVNPFTVDGSTFVMNGIFSSATRPKATLLNNATLRGIGTLGDVDVNSGTVAPGRAGTQTIGTLTSDNFNLTSGAHLVLDIRGSGAGAYDQISAKLTLSIDGSLAGTVTSDAAFNAGDLFFILVNASANVSDTGGTFVSLADNPTTPAQVIFTGGPTGTTAFEIGYHGDSGTNSFTGGNDIVLRALTTIAIPEPASLSLLASASVGLLGFRRRRAA